MYVYSLTETLIIFFQLVFYLIILCIIIGSIYILYLVLKIIVSAILHTGSTIKIETINVINNLCQIISKSRVLSVFSIIISTLILICISPILIEIFLGLLYGIFVAIAAIVGLILLSALIILMLGLFFGS